MLVYLIVQIGVTDQLVEVSNTAVILQETIPSRCCTHEVATETTIYQPCEVGGIVRAETLAFG